LQLFLIFTTLTYLLPGLSTYQDSPSWLKVKPKLSLSSSGTACHSSDLSQ